MKRIATFLFLIVMLVVSAVSVSANGELSGRDFVRLGELRTISGILQFEDGEWYLHTDSAIYEIHLGDHTFREGLGLTMHPGDKADVTGFLYGTDMATVSLLLGSTEYRLRTDQGVPLWAGMNRARALAAQAAFSSETAFGEEGTADVGAGAGFTDTMGGRFRAIDPDAAHQPPGLGGGSPFWENVDEHCQDTKEKE